MKFKLVFLLFFFSSQCMALSLEDIKKGVGQLQSEAKKTAVKAYGDVAKTAGDIKKEVDKAGEAISLGLNSYWVKNNYKNDIYTAVYSVSAPLGRFVSANRKTNLYKLKSNTKYKYSLPNNELDKMRMLMFTSNQSHLRSSLNKYQYSKIAKTPVGNLSSLYIYQGKDYKLQASLLDIASHKHPAQGSKIRIGKPSSSLEDSFLAKRKNITSKALKSIIGKGEDLKIYCAISGGGARALVTGSGFVDGLKKAGLLDTVSGISGLSGGSWCLSTLMTREKDFNKSVDTQEEYLIDRLGKDIKPASVITPANIVERISYRKTNNRPGNLVIVDLYSLFLSKIFLNYLAKDATIYSTHEHIRDGACPWPLYSSMVPTGYENLWMTWSPSEVGIHRIGAYAETKHFGSSFENGNLLDRSPHPYSLGYMQSVCGLAFAGSINEFAEIFGITDNVIWKTAIANENVSQGRFITAKMNNYLYGLDVSNNDLISDKKLNGADAGLDCNLPIPPCMARDADIIIICDAGNFSGDAFKNPGAELIKFKEYAEREKLKIPTINTVTKDIVSIFPGSKSNGIPTFIYLPLVKNPKSDFVPDPDTYNYLKTLNFYYKSDEVKQLFRHMSSNVVDAKDKIIEAMKSHAVS